MDAFEALSGRASVREYEPGTLDDATIEQLVDAGRRAPTARAVEPWEFVVVKDRGMLEELGSLADHGPFIKDAACCIAVYCEDTKYYLEDGSAATENILIAAAALGLGACWVAGDKKAYAKEVSEALGVPPEMKLISLIPVGRPAQKPWQDKKRKLEEVIHWEKF